MKPRILFLVPADYDALCRKGVDRMIRERDELGFFERVITVHPIAQWDRVIDLGAIHRIHEFSLGRAISPGAPLGARLTAPLRFLIMARALVRIARAERIDLIRANDPYLMGLLAWWLGRTLNIPYCVSLHADYAKRFELTPKRGVAAWLRRLARLAPRFVIPRAALMLPIREHMASWIEQNGGLRSAIRVIPHGVDPGPFVDSPRVDARTVFHVPAGAPVVSFVGRLSADNYASEVATVIDRVVRTRRGTICVLVGEGPAEAEIRQRLAGLSAVRIFPFQPYEHVVALRRVSSVSLCLMAGFSLIEACAAGSPVVAYDVEWHRELVRDGVTGFLVREHDVDGAVSAVERLLDNPVAAAEMGRNAQRVALARHDIQSTTAIKRQCYADVLGSRHALAG